MPTALLRLFVLAAFTAIGSVPNGVVYAQLDILDGLPGGNSGAGPAQKLVSVQAEFTAGGEGEPARLFITARIAAGWHTYSITQAPEGPIATKLKLDPSPDYQTIGDFTPSPPPKSRVDDVAYKGLTLETHEGSVTWEGPLQFAVGVDPARVEILGEVYAQVCNEQSCLPPQGFPFTARLRRSPNAPKEQAADDRTQVQGRPVETLGVYTSRRGTVIRGRLEPQVAVPGGKAKLILSAEPVEGWHVYALADHAPQGLGNKPTLIVLDQTSGLEAGRPVESATPLAKAGQTLGQHQTPVSWTVELAVPQNAEPGEFSIAGLLAYQTCTNNDASCDRPESVRFEAKLPVAFTSVAGESPVHFSGAASYPQAGESASSARASGPAEFEFELAGDRGGRSLALMMATGFLGGLILNLMPCVLPVIGLKILSFVQQSGRERWHVFLLNLSYSLGLLSVFMVLATLPVISHLFWNEQFGWGKQFTSLEFNIAMAAIVWAMALCFLGVWEIPIPGFVGSGTATELAAQEGFAGAFLKGVLTTVLATPCSGPLLGPALGFAVAQPPHVTYTMFGCVGLGMASPYLAIGAFPALIRFLPKPGAWMDTFKQVMGFVLLVAVVWLLNVVKTIDPGYVIPSFAFLMGLWAAFWWIGRTPLFADLGRRLRAWTAGAVVASLAGAVAFGWLVPGEELLDWRPFSKQALEEHISAGKTVLVDFTAVW